MTWTDLVAALALGVPAVACCAIALFDAWTGRRP